MQVANITSGYGYSVVHSPKSSKLVLSCHDSTLGMTHHEERGGELGGGGISTKILSLPGNSLGVKQVSCGRNHFMVLATNGTGMFTCTHTHTHTHTHTQLQLQLQCRYAFTAHFY